MTNTTPNEHTGREPRIGGMPFLSLLGRSALRLRWLYGSVMACWTLIYGIPLVVGALFADLIDQAGKPPVDSGTWWLLWAAVALTAVRALVLWVGLQLTFTLIFRTSAWMKVQVLGRLLGRPSAHAAVDGNGEILNRLRDDTDEIGGLLEWTTDLLYRSVLLVIAVAVLVRNDLVMTAPLLLQLVGLWGSVFLKRRVADLQAETRTRQGRIGAEITDTLTGIRDLRLAGAIEGRLAALERKFAERRAVQLRHQVYLDLLSDLFRNLVTVGTAVVLLTVAVRVADGGFTVGKLVLFLTYASWLGQQMYFFGKILARYQGGKVAYGRLAQLAGDENGPAASVPDEPLRELTVSGLTSVAPEGVRGIEPVDFRVRPGQLVAVTGEIGSGKSTVVRALLGLQPEVLGSVHWNGTDVTGNTAALAAPRVGYARQQSKFVGGTLRENLLLGDEDIPAERLAAALAAVNLRPGSAELPLGLDTELDSGEATQISGGQRQRLALARMLCRPAEVYVVDDCDSSLDGPTAREIWRTLPEQWPGAWIVVSHNPELIAAADTVVTVTRGRVPEPVAAS